MSTFFSNFRIVSLDLIDISHLPHILKNRLTRRLMKKEKARSSYDKDVRRRSSFLTRRNFFHISAVTAARKGFPKDLTMEKGNVPSPFPLLIDEDRKLTGGLGLFTSEWGGSKADQMVPSVFILDKNGVL